VGGSFVTGNTSNTTNITNVNMVKNESLEREALELQKAMLAEKQKVAQMKLQEIEDRTRLEKETAERERQEAVRREQQAREQAIKDEKLCRIQEECAKTYISLMNERSMKKYLAWVTTSVDANYSSTVRGLEGKITNHVGIDSLIESAKNRFGEKVSWTGFKILSNTRNGIIFMIKMTWPKSGYVWGTQCKWNFSDDGILLTGKWDPNGFGV
jgi:hypothetical protein